MLYMSLKMHKQNYLNTVWPLLKQETGWHSDYRVCLNSVDN